MSTSRPEEQAKDPVPTPSRDAQYWAKAVSRLDVNEVPIGAINLNVAGRRVTSPAQGFGKMWQKTYRVELGEAVAPTEVIRTWRANFSDFWPAGNKFFGPLTGIAPGEVAILNLKVPGHIKLSTGVLVIYADDESFSFMTPEGHSFAALITFSSAVESGATVVQVQALLRAADPLYEVGMMLGIQPRMEDRFWISTLTSLARHFGVADADVTIESRCVDSKRQWRNAKYVWHNAFIRSILYTIGAPVRAIGKRARNGGTGTEGGSGSSQT